MYSLHIGANILDISLRIGVNILNINKDISLHIGENILNINKDIFLHIINGKSKKSFILSIFCLIAPILDLVGTIVSYILLPTRFCF